MEGARFIRVCPGEVPEDTSFTKTVARDILHSGPWAPLAPCPAVCEVGSVPSPKPGIHELHDHLCRDGSAEGPLLDRTLRAGPQETWLLLEFRPRHQATE